MKTLFQQNINIKQKNNRLALKEHKSWVIQVTRSFHRYSMLTEKLIKFLKLDMKFYSFNILNL